MEPEEKKYPIVLKISEEVKAKLDSERILEEQAAHTVDSAKDTTDCAQRGDRHSYRILLIGHATYWVEYRP